MDGGGRWCFCTDNGSCCFFVNLVLIEEGCFTDGEHRAVSLRLVTMRHQIQMLEEITGCDPQQCKDLLQKANGCVSLACDMALGLESLSGLQPPETRGWAGSAQPDTTDGSEAAMEADAELRAQQIEDLVNMAGCNKVAYPLVYY